MTVTLASGARIGAYEIQSALGSGGMGEVYRARDTRLGRDVALKFVPADLVADPVAVERFYREARAIAALNHPNICTIHDIGAMSDGPFAGRPFLVMEVVEGQTLAEYLNGKPLDLSRVIALALDLTDAIGTAHGKGIVHRDIKPANIFVTPRGAAKLLDFGLAKSTGAEARGDSETIATPLTGRGRSDLTERGVTVGTVAYMSPEQALGEPVDGRSDLFSLGAVLYEMSTGVQPFRAKTAAGVFHAILSEAPPSPSAVNPVIPGALDAVVAKCLEKEPRSRYQSARELHEALSNLSAGQVSGAALERPRGRTRKPKSSQARTKPSSSGAIDSVVVLPFENESGNPDNDYLSSGITDGIINSLSKIGSLRVVPRSVAFSYKGKSLDPLAIAKSLRVRAVVSGRLTRQGDSVGVGAEMVDAVKVAQIWGDQYKRPFPEIVTLQQEVVHDIVRNLRVKLGTEEEGRLRQRPTTNPEAYQLYLRGKLEFEHFTREGLTKAIDYFERAIERDPRFAAAYVDLARAHMLMARFIPATPAIVRRVRTLVNQALALDDSFGGAHFVLGAIKWMYDWNGPAAGEHFRRGLELDPYFESLAYDGWLAAHGRHEEAIAEARRTLALNPTSLPNLLMLVTILLGGQRWDAAITEAERAGEMYPHAGPAHESCGLAYLCAGRFDDAERSLERAVSMGHVQATSLLGIVYARTNRRAQADAILERLLAGARSGQLPPVAPCQLCVALGRTDEAFEWLDRSLAARNDGWLLFLRIDPLLAPLSSDPRWADLLARVEAAARHD